MFVQAVTQIQTTLFESDVNLTCCAKMAELINFHDFALQFVSILIPD